MHLLAEAIRDVDTGADEAKVGDVLVLEDFSGSCDLKHKTALRRFRTYLYDVKKASDVCKQSERYRQTGPKSSQLNGCGMGGCKHVRTRHELSE